MNINKFTKLSYIINVYILILLILETFIWIINKHFNTSLSPLHKVLYYILPLLYLFLVKNIRFIYVLILSLPFFLSAFYTLFLVQSLQAFFVSISDALRIVTIFSLFYYIRLLVVQKKIDISFLEKFIFISFFVLFINMLLGSIGLGNAQRHGGIGTRGFFHAGNDVSTLSGILASFLFSKFYSNKKKFILYVVIFFWFAYLLNTKAIVAGYIIILFLLPIYDKIGSKMRKKHFYFTLSFVFVAPLILVFIFLISYNLGFLDRYLTFASQYKNESILTFLLSRRDLFVEKALIYVNDSYGVIEYLIGGSSGVFLENAQRTEIDVTDLFFFFGITGLLFFYPFIIYNIFVLLKNNKSKDNFELRRGAFCANIFLLSVSITSGHVATSALICLYLGIFNAFFYDKEK
ncbi:O-antigen ligase family protein [Flammeovirga sp. OC4]|uniref:O-antigen ligase family protein n=1 Tax=Flammeovirga sp. OC4 TaxID=1382345 RepID=UPI0005C60650|nr:O-antigen ligase family protein [Flammeovirga sp. OC4]